MAGAASVGVARSAAVTPLAPICPTILHTWVVGQACFPQMNGNQSQSSTGSQEIEGATLSGPHLLSAGPCPQPRKGYLPGEWCTPAFTLSLSVPGSSGARYFGGWGLLGQPLVGTSVPRPSVHLCPTCSQEGLGLTGKGHGYGAWWCLNEVLHKDGGNCGSRSDPLRISGTGKYTTMAVCALGLGSLITANNTKEYFTACIQIQISTGATPRRSAASLLVDVTSPQILPGKSVPVGKTGQVTVSIKAAGGTVHAISLGKGLLPSTNAAAVTASPPGLSGFTLHRGASRQFVFKIKTAKPGKVTLTVNAAGKTSSGAAVQGAGKLEATVGGVSGIVVNTTSDAAIDPKALNETPPVCAIDLTAAKALCSLRAAIQLVNKLGGDQSIDFDIRGSGVPRIAPATPLPAVTARATIDGTTQAAGWVEVSGAAAGGGDGLELDGDSSTIRGLVINGFTQGAAIKILGARSLIAGDRIGTNTTGLTAVPNVDGVLVDGPDAIIGGTDGTSPTGCTGDCDLISGNTSVQVDAENDTGVPFGGLKIQGDWIGVNSAGDHAFSDEGEGVQLIGLDTYEISAADTISVGGTTSRAGLAPGNLIYASRYAVYISGLMGASGVEHAATVSGNLIGLDATGTKAIGSGNIGVEQILTSAEVGGTTPGARNVISGFAYGVGDGGGNLDGNFIGTDISGTTAVPNNVGVTIAQQSGPDSTGLYHFSRGFVGNNNVISGNHIGIESIEGAAILGTGNLIGLAANGMDAIPNSIGISAISVEIGTGYFQSVSGGPYKCSSDPCDVISGNTAAGIQDRPPLNGSSESTLFEIAGAYIGTDITGTRSVPNGVGVEAPANPNSEHASHFEFGGASTAFKGGGCNFPCDLIAGNKGEGLLLDTDAGSAQGAPSFIEGSYIGLSANGSPLPNGGPGIDILGLPSANPMLIGGDTAKGNVLAGSTAPAVTVTGTATAKTPPVALITNRYEMNGPLPPIARTLIPPPPVLTDTVSGPTVDVTGSTNVPSDPKGPGETVEIYASAACGGTRQPVGSGIPATLTGNFEISVPLAALRSLRYLTALRTD